MIHVTCRLTAKNRDQLRNPTLGYRVWATYFTFGRRNESAPKQLAQCRFSGLAISNAKVLINIFRYPRVHGRNFFKQHSETVMD